MKRLLVLALVLILTPGTSAAAALLEGRGCIRLDDSVDLRQARLLVRNAALHRAIASSGVLAELPLDAPPALTRGIVQILRSGHLEAVRVLEHTETDDVVCETVEVRADLETLRRVARREVARTAPGGEPALADNDCLSLLALEENEDRYGRRVTAVVRVERSTGPLHSPAHRRNKPWYKVCIDYLGPGGVPWDGDAHYIDDSADGLLQGELRTVDFHVPEGVESYRVWLPEKPEKQPVTRTSTGTKGPERTVSKAPEPEAAPRPVESVEASDGPDGLRVEILSNGPIQRHRPFYMDGPPRLVIDLPGRWERPGFHARRLDSPVAECIRVGHHPDKLRLVLDLRRDGPPPEAVIQETPKGLVVEIRAR